MLELFVQLISSDGDLWVWDLRCRAVPRHADFAMRQLRARLILERRQCECVHAMRGRDILDRGRRRHPKHRTFEHSHVGRQGLRHTGLHGSEQGLLRVSKLVLSDPCGMEARCQRRRESVGDHGEHLGHGKGVSGGWVRLCYAGVL